MLLYCLHFIESSKQREQNLFNFEMYNRGKGCSSGKAQQVLAVGKIAGSSICSRSEEAAKHHSLEKRQSSLSKLP